MTVLAKRAGPLRVLILGGTGFIGPHFVRAALARGHRVAVFNRGRSGTRLPAEVEQLTGDRSVHLGAIAGREWDCVFDLAVYEPVWVRTLGRALAASSPHYTLVSSVAVYADEPMQTLESSRLKAYPADLDPFAPPPPVGDFNSLSLEDKRKALKQYGAGKVISEQEAARQFPGRCLAIRPHAIIGPGDNTNHVYWFARLLRGGEALVPGDPGDPFQYIDVRDLADFSLRMAEQGRTGAYNVLGPIRPTTWGQFIQSIHVAAGAHNRLTWVPSEWLLRQAVEQTELPLWFPFPDRPEPRLLEWANYRLSNAKAVAAGLACRPLQETSTATVASVKDHPPRLPAGWGMVSDREAELLARWHATAGR